MGALTTTICMIVSPFKLQFLLFHQIPDTQDDQPASKQGNQQIIRDDIRKKNAQSQRNQDRSKGPACIFSTAAPLSLPHGCHRLSSGDFRWHSIKKSTYSTIFQSPDLVHLISRSTAICASNQTRSIPTDTPPHKPCAQTAPSPSQPARVPSTEPAA